jgi:hypothetical protein
MTNVFFFVYQLEAVLAEMRRTLAPGGRIAIYTDATAFMAPPFIAHRMGFYTDDPLSSVLQDDGYAAITLQRTGPGRRMQLATDRNGAAHEPARYQSAEPGDFSSVLTGRS